MKTTRSTIKNLVLISKTRKIGLALNAAITVTLLGPLAVVAIQNVQGVMQVKGVMRAQLVMRIRTTGPVPSVVITCMLLDQVAENVKRPDPPTSQRCPQQVQLQRTKCVQEIGPVLSAMTTTMLPAFNAASAEPQKRNNKACNNNKDHLLRIPVGIRPTRTPHPRDMLNPPDMIHTATILPLGATPPAMLMLGMARALLATRPRRPLPPPAIAMGVMKEPGLVMPTVGPAVLPLPMPPTVLATVAAVPLPQLHLLVPRPPFQAAGPATGFAPIVLSIAMLRGGHAASATLPSLACRGEEAK